MKALNLFLMGFFLGSVLWAQSKPTIGVLNLNTEGTGFCGINAGNMARHILEKMAVYEIMDKQDIKFLLKDSGQTVDHCFGKLCLIQIGRKIKADKMFGGTICQLNGKIVVSTRIIDIAGEAVEKSAILEFEPFREQTQAMLEIAIQSMFGWEIDSVLFKKLSLPHQLESTFSEPYAKRLKLNGPRMGYTLFTGKTAQRLAQPLDEGGFDAAPLMFQFGYQFETQYLNEGNYQALFEFIPMITGVDQGYFIPSLSILHGLRNNRNGWEIALGPTLSLVSEAEGFYEDGIWKLKTADTQVKTQWRMDSRGSARLKSGMVFAVGKTFRSGKLNLPFNAFVIPGNDGIRFGLSFGFNAKK
jgi:hypothetical protein